MPPRAAMPLPPPPMIPPRFITTPPASRNWRDAHFRWARMALSMAPVTPAPPVPSTASSNGRPAAGFSHLKLHQISSGPWLGDLFALRLVHGLAKYRPLGHRSGAQSGEIDYCGLNPVVAYQTCSTLSIAAGAMIGLFPGRTEKHSRLVDTCAGATRLPALTSASFGILWNSIPLASLTAAPRT